MLAENVLVLPAKHAVILGANLAVFLGVFIRRQILGRVGTACFLGGLVSGCLLGLLRFLDKLNLGCTRQTKSSGKFLERERSHVKRVLVLLEVDGPDV